MTEIKSDYSEQCNADELVAPKWLNENFFTEILSKYENDSKLKVLELKISPASAKGDHYASIIFRVGVEYTTQNRKLSKSLIVKTLPDEEGPKKETLGGSKFFETEIGMYSEVLPKFEKILREVGDDTILNAQCIYHSLEPRKVIIFEDLVPLGYSVIRDRSSSKEELQRVFLKLAKLHALSMKVQHEQPEFLKEYKHGLFDMPNFLEGPFITRGMRLFIEFLDQQPELSKYKPYFEKIKNDYLLRLRDIMVEFRENRQLNGYYVLCHGDFHLRNIMFKHHQGTGAFEDVMLLDYQISNLCPITIDIIYSIYMVMGPEQRWDEWEQWINYYFSTLVEMLKRIDFKGEMPNSADFWKLIYKHKYYDFFLVSTFLPMMWAIKSNKQEIAEIIQNEESGRQSYQTQGYIEDVKKLLHRFEKLGYFNVE